MNLRPYMPAWYGLERMHDYIQRHQGGSMGVFADELHEAAQALRFGADATIKLGEYAYRWAARGENMGAIREYLLDKEGVTLPSDSRLSTYKKVYEAWCRRGGLQPNEVVKHPEALDNQGTMIHMTLAGVPIDKLSNLKGLVEDKSSAMDLLAYAYTHTDAECRALRKGGESQASRNEGRTPVKSFKINEDSYKSFLTFLDRLRNVMGDPHVSRAQLFDFMLGQFDDISDDALRYLWRDAHGELTEDEQYEREVLDVE